jgi:hypothetical protein
MTAPYIDPDGHPSYQPSPRVRKLDALSRRARLVEDVTRAHQRLLDAEQEVLNARQALADTIETLNFQTRLALTYASQQVLGVIEADQTDSST